jgi:plastocyanin
MRKPLRHRRLVVAGAVTAFALLGACGGNDAKSSTASDKTTVTSADAGGTDTGATATDKVTVKDFAFGPKSVSVKAGGTITWTNEDSFDHAIQIDSLKLSGPKFGPQTMPTSYSHQFDTPGTYPYICGVHNSMTGTVIVTN